MLRGVADELRHGMNFQFAQEVAALGLECFDADAELCGDFLARFAVGDQTQGLSLSGGELFQCAVACPDLFANLGDLTRKRKKTC